MLGQTRFGFFLLKSSTNTETSEGDLKEEKKMEPEATMFETSETLARFLASTPLLYESWRVCDHVNNLMVPCDFIVDRVGNVCYIGFSSALNLELIVNDNSLVPIGDEDGLFSALCGGGDDEEDAPMVHAGFLKLFYAVFNTIDFQTQMKTIMEQSKAIIITGHSTGGTIASLATLWMLSLSSHPSVLCITFGSPLLGNESLSQAILRERWGGSFCHTVSKHDIVPRILFITAQQNIEDVNMYLNYVLAHIVSRTKTMQEGHLMDGNSYRPFGSYMFCCEEGAICVDNANAVVKMLHLMLMDASTKSSYIDDHYRYGEVVNRVSQQFLMSSCSTEGVLLDNDDVQSSYEIGTSLALEASGLAKQDFVAEEGRKCLTEARQMGRAPSLNSTNLAILHSKVAPYRAQIEWYKARCDDSNDRMGYYDTFKLRGASKRELKVNLNRLHLATFWNKMLQMIEENKLPHGFYKRMKWVNAAQFYKLLVEPLDIADYYRSDMHISKGHYLTHGREKRYKVFDRWWKNRKVLPENYKRNKYAGLTQDSCFWARVEEAKEWIKTVKVETDQQQLDQLWKNIEEFELYATKLVENKEVSKDVIAENSSYSIWVKELQELKKVTTNASAMF